MKTKTIQITISTDGQINIEAVEFHGPDCESATAFLEQALGKIVNRHRKPEYFRRAVIRQQQKLGT